MAKVETANTPYGKDVTITKSSDKKPGDKDYVLRRIEINPAKNTEGGEGVIVECCMELKPDVKKMRHQEEMYSGEYREPEKYIADNYDDGIDFIITKLQKMKSDSKKA